MHPETRNGLPLYRTSTPEQRQELWRRADAQTTISLAYVEATPEFWREVIARPQDEQRGPIPTKVQRYSNDMSNGNWAETDEPVSVSRPHFPQWRALCQNGNNRGHAAVSADKTLYFLFRFGVPAEDIGSYDPDTRPLDAKIRMQGRKVIPRNSLGSIFALERTDFEAAPATCLGSKTKERIVLDVSDDDMRSILTLDRISRSSSLKVSLRGTLAIMYRLLRDSSAQQKEALLKLFVATLSNDSTAPGGGAVSNQLANYLANRVCKGSSRSAILNQVIGVQRAADAFLAGRDRVRFSKPSETEIENLNRAVNPSATQQQN